jgi:hypothetical protein
VPKLSQDYRIHTHAVTILTRRCDLLLTHQEYEDKDQLTGKGLSADDAGKVRGNTASPLAPLLMAKSMGPMFVLYLGHTDDDSKKRLGTRGIIIEEIRLELSNVGNERSSYQYAAKCDTMSECYNHLVGWSW